MADEGLSLKTKEGADGPLRLVIDSGTMEFKADGENPKKLAAKTVIQPSTTISVVNGDTPSVITSAGLTTDGTGVKVNTGLTTKTINGRLEVDPEGFMSSSVYIN